ncbi:hypothetical protein M501DRAFT_997816 [Patellaria atrata CBS 101060]|uniref:Uncharacterized protein n=1 Tax=Patellaria atrata CBS 101060 TaxID=1346257 RepID=A0A9P4S4J0_9PEZI|nr:hypothetical protein M501DRAFT_997816 [Patellaria atrata CBS 101060]
MCKQSTCQTCSKSRQSPSLTSPQYPASSTLPHHHHPAPPNPHSKILTPNINTDKATWWGCGNHVPSVMDRIPEADRCVCSPKIEREGKAYPPKAEFS